MVIEFLELNYHTHLSEKLILTQNLKLDIFIRFDLLEFFGIIQHLQTKSIPKPRVFVLIHKLLIPSGKSTTKKKLRQKFSPIHFYMDS